MTDNDKILVHATKAFVRELRREFDRRRPQGPNPVIDLAEMRPLDQASFLRCVKAAIAASKQDVEAFSGA